MTNISHKLTDFLKTHVPATQYMGFDVAHYDGETLQLSAPLAPNINDKSTAFGGSLYSLCVMTCWGMLYLKTQEKGIECNQVVMQSNIRFLAPVNQTLTATCHAPSPETLENFFNRFTEKGRAKIDLTATMLNANQQPAVTFESTYGILPAQN